MCRLSLRTARSETWRGQSRERQTDRVARQTDPRHRRSPLRFGPHPPRDHRSLVADVGVKGTVETRERERDERIPSGCRWAVSPQHAPPLGSAPNSACRVSPVCGTHLEVPLNVIIPCPSFSRFSSLLSFCRAHVRPKLPTAATDDTYKHARTSSTGGVSLSLSLSWSVSGGRPSRRRRHHLRHHHRRHRSRRSCSPRLFLLVARRFFPRRLPLPSPVPFLASLSPLHRSLSHSTAPPIPWRTAPPAALARSYVHTYRTR